MKNEILAPMPGLVARVIVNEGDEIKEGEVVAVINVMKMEVEVKSNKSGKVNKILVKEWDELDVGTPMIILSDFNRRSIYLRSEKTP